MVKFVVALVLLAGVVKISAPWIRCYEHQNILFSSEENNKVNNSDVKEKQEEQAFPESGSLVAGYPDELNKLPSDLHQFIPARHDEPSSPPPNIVRS